MIIEVELDVSCPFYYTVSYDNDGYADSDSMCALLEGDCCGLAGKKCPLKEDSILVQRKS